MWTRNRGQDPARRWDPDPVLTDYRESSLFQSGRDLELPLRRHARAVLKNLPWKSAIPTCQPSHLSELPWLPPP